jgi:hypothetical protein
VDEDEEGEDPVPLSRNPSCVRNTSMSLSFAQPKRKAVFFNPLVADANLEEGEEGEEGEDLDDDDTIMSQHHISGSNPYENKRCATLVREMSAAPDYSGREEK